MFIGMRSVLLVNVYTCIYILSECLCMASLDCGLICMYNSDYETLELNVCVSVKSFHIYLTWLTGKFVYSCAGAHQFIS